MNINITNMPTQLTQGLVDIRISPALVGTGRSGQYLHKEKIIELHPSFVNYELVVYHEMGHHYGNMTGADDTQEWIDIYYNEWKYEGVYASQNRWEAFADAIAAYYVGPTKLFPNTTLEHKPLTERYLNKILKGE